MNSLIKRSFATATTKRPIVLSGIQPTGTPHLGNYLGALANWARLQEPDVNGVQPKNFYMLADLHAITMPQDPGALLKSKLDMSATLLACGVDPKRSVLFEQSKVKAHPELAWIFNCITPVGWLGRMTQWKTKMENRGINHSQVLSDENMTTGLKMGLFNYPVLQAADILLYKATHVPVGQDQMQHLELSRDIASLFNNTFNTSLFIKPDAIIPPVAKRIMSLREPEKKMSKSDPSDLSRLNLVDPPELIKKKISKATTDGIRGVSYNIEERPGMSNLVGIYAAMRDIEVDEAVKEFSDVTSTKVFKDQVAEAIIERLQPIQKELVRLQNDMGYVKQVLEKGAQDAGEVAYNTMDEVNKIVGLR